MDELLSERDSVNRELHRIIDEPTESPWGIRVERVEIKDVSLPESMKRSMSRQAEAELERRARIITADGEYQASKRLAMAANVMARDPAASGLVLVYRGSAYWRASPLMAGTTTGGTAAKPGRFQRPSFLLVTHLPGRTARAGCQVLTRRLRPVTRVAARGCVPLARGRPAEPRPWAA
jgi:hypothetical protein